MSTTWKVLIRDVAIVFVATNLGGMVVGFLGATLVGPDALSNVKVQSGLAFSNFIFGIVGYTIVGSLKKCSRFKHLFIVAFCNWLLSAPSLLFTPFTLQQWLMAPIFLTIVVLIGGGLSYLFASSPGEAQSGT